MLADAVRKEISQGDILSELPVVEYEDGEVVTRVINAIIMSHDCEFDKKIAKHCVVAELRAPADAPSGGWGDIVKYRVYNALYLGGPVNVIGEAFIDYRRLYRVEKSTIRARAEGGGRVGSLTDKAREALIYGLLYFLKHDPDSKPGPNPLA